MVIIYCFSACLSLESTSRYEMILRKIHGLSIENGEEVCYTIIVSLSLLTETGGDYNETGIDEKRTDSSRKAIL